MLRIFSVGVNLIHQKVNVDGETEGLSENGGSGGGYEDGENQKYGLKDKVVKNQTGVFFVIKDKMLDKLFVFFFDK